MAAERVASMAGKLIVFEGTDGSGKATQTALLCSELDRRGIPYRRLEFPRYSEDSSALIRLYLGGAFGSDPGDVNAYAAASFYAVDRYASYKQDWGAFYESGGLVIADRYTTSNAVHQTSKLPAGERRAFLDWLFDFEYGKLGLPAPTRVLYLDMPTELSEQMMRRRAADPYPRRHPRAERRVSARLPRKRRLRGGLLRLAAHRLRRRKPHPPAGGDRRACAARGGGSACPRLTQRKTGPQPRFPARSAGAAGVPAAAAVSAAAAAVSIAAAAAAEQQNQNDDEPEAGAVVVVKAHAKSPHLFFLTHCMPYRPRGYLVPA